MALPESGKLEFYAAWAGSVGQSELSDRLRESALRVRRMERTLDELVDEAAEDERVVAARGRRHGQSESFARGHGQNEVLPEVATCMGISTGVRPERPKCPR